MNCPQCGHKNAKHYKFCLECGAEIPSSPSKRPSKPLSRPRMGIGDAFQEEKPSTPGAETLMRKVEDFSSDFGMKSDPTGPPPKDLRDKRSALRSGALRALSAGEDILSATDEGAESPRSEASDPVREVSIVDESAALEAPIAEPSVAPEQLVAEVEASLPDETASSEGALEEDGELSFDINTSIGRQSLASFEAEIFGDEGLGNDEIAVNLEPAIEQDAVEEVADVSELSEVSGGVGGSEIASPPSEANSPPALIPAVEAETPSTPKVSDKPLKPSLSPLGSPLASPRPSKFTQPELKGALSLSTPKASPLSSPLQSKPLGASPLGRSLKPSLAQSASELSSAGDASSKAPSLTPASPAKSITPAPAQTPSAPAQVEPVQAAPVQVAPVQVAPAQPEMISCGTCNALVPSSFRFCGSCGSPITSEAKPDVAEPSGASHKPVQEGPTYTSPPELSEDVPSLTLVHIHLDGSEGDSIVISAHQPLIGRNHECAIFQSDQYLSPEHCEVVFKQDQTYLKDLGGLNGIFIKLTKPGTLRFGDFFRAGQQLFCLEQIADESSPSVGGTKTLGSPPYEAWGRLCHIIGGGGVGRAWLLQGDEIKLGRVRGEIIFDQDRFMSSSHCALQRRGDQVTLYDQGSTNGTFIRIREEVALQDQDLILLGQKIFRVHLS